MKNKYEFYITYYFKYHYYTRGPRREQLLAKTPHELDRHHVPWLPNRQLHPCATAIVAAALPALSAGADRDHPHRGDARGGG